MQRLSAIDAISPAWEHVRRLLLSPPSWRLLLKIGAVSCFAQMSGGSANFGAPLKDTGQYSSLLLPVLFVVSLLLLAIGLGLFYLSSRLQFVLFEVVLKQETVIAPIWRRYGRVTWRWIALKIGFLLAALLCIAPILIPVILHFAHTIPAGPAVMSAGRTFAIVFELFAAIFLLLFVMGVGFVLLLDFGLPSMALENTSVGETLRRVWSLILAEPLEIALYLLMKFLLIMAGAIVAYIALLIGALVLLIPLGGASLGLWFALRHATGGGHLLLIAGWVVASLILLVLMTMAAIMAFGYLLTFLQAYAIYFLAGRYPLLGEILDPTPGLPFTPPPPLRGPDEPDGSGPDLPMSPAVV